MSDAANFFFLAGSSLRTQWLSSGVLGRCLSHGALEQAGKVGNIRDTYLLCGLRDRVMMIPAQVRRKLAQGIGPSFGLVLMVALGYNEQLGATQPFEVALKMRYPALFAVRRE